MQKSKRVHILHSGFSGGIGLAAAASMLVNAVLTDTAVVKRTVAKPQQTADKPVVKRYTYRVFTPEQIAWNKEVDAKRLAKQRKLEENI